MNPSQALATVLVDELLRLGVREAVLCPGSRSAPLAYALHAADRAGRLRLHVRIDERSAGFLALGLAKVTGEPAPVCTTSGTAVANLHPAVLEAHEAGVPMLLLTADRPAELRGTGANQTTDQVKIFGPAVRWAHDLGTPTARVGEQGYWRTTADRGFASATGALGGEPGPVHLNIPLRDPLAPDLADDPGDPGETDWPEPLDGRPGGVPWTGVQSRAGSRGPAVGHAGPAPRTLVVVGDLPAHRRLHEPVFAWAAGCGYPVLTEPFGPRPAGTTVLPYGNLMAAAVSLRPELRPDRVLVFGRPTLSREVAGLFRLSDTSLELVPFGPRWTDPGHRAHRVHPAVELGAPTDPPDAGWLGAWRAAAALVHSALEPGTTRPWPTGPAVAHTVLTALPVGSRLFLGSSMAVRGIDAARRETDTLDVVASRGLGGIDGCVATAVGIALADPATPAYALLGDLTFLHDGNALAIGPCEARPDLTILVVNDDGGTIFATLEYGEPARLDADPHGFRRVFATPTGADLAARCAAHGVPHARVTSAGELAQQIDTKPDGLRVVEIDAAGVDRRVDARRRADLVARALRV